MNDIIFLWSHPRSVSSAMERVMLERGDMATFHEPFLYVYYVHDGKRELIHFEADPDHPRSYEGIRDMLLAEAERRAVFVKDMSYYVLDYLRDDPAFVQRVTNTFLIRTPEQSIPSYYRLDEGVTEEEIGLEAEYHHFELVRELTGKVPVVVDAQDIQRDTEAAVRAYCEALGIRFVPESLTWEEGLPPEWGHVAGWHQEVSRTSGLGEREPRKLGLDADPKLQRFYAHHLPYYLELRKHRLRV